MRLALFRIGDEAAEAYGARCLRPDAPLTTEWQSGGGGGGCERARATSLQDYLDGLYDSAATVRQWDGHP